MILIKLLSCLGLVWIIKDSYILAVPRNFLKSKSKHIKEFLSCSLCIGFWVGLLLGLFEYKFNNSLKIDYFFYPTAIAAFCWFFDSLLDLIQERWVSLKNSKKNIES